MLFASEPKMLLSFYLTEVTAVHSWISLFSLLKVRLPPTTALFDHTLPPTWCDLTSQAESGADRAAASVAASDPAPGRVQEKAEAEWVAAG